jgi:hypothetical protein
MKMDNIALDAPFAKLLEECALRPIVNFFWRSRTQLVRTWVQVEVNTSRKGCILHGR